MNNPFAAASTYKYALLLPVCSIFALTIVTPALADNSITLKRGQLQPATWHKAPLEYQIVDDRPRVVDTRVPDAAPGTITIPVPPLADASGSSSNAGIKMVHNGLQQSGFTTNIPAGGMAVARDLPATKSGGLSPVDKPAARPIGMPGAQAKVSGRVQPPSTVAKYRDYEKAPVGLSASSGASRESTKEAIGRLIQRDK